MAFLLWKFGSQENPIATLEITWSKCMVSRSSKFQGGFFKQFVRGRENISLNASAFFILANEDWHKFLLQIIVKTRCTCIILDLHISYTVELKFPFLLHFFSVCLHVPFLSLLLFWQTVFFSLSLLDNGDFNKLDFNPLVFVMFMNLKRETFAEG